MIEITDSMNLRDGMNGEGMNRSDNLLTYLFLPSRIIRTDLKDMTEISSNKETSLPNLGREISREKTIFKHFDNVMMKTIENITLYSKTQLSTLQSTFLLQCCALLSINSLYDLSSSLTLVLYNIL